MAKLPRVEMHHAFFWICDACGEENIIVPIRIETEETLRNIATSGYIFSSSPISGEGNIKESSLFFCPRQLRCRACKAKYMGVMES